MTIDQAAVKSFNTPILFLIFNRPDCTQQVFNAIKSRQPKYLFVAADGPRPRHPEDIELCDRCREISTAIDWDCEVELLFRDENLGCGAAPATAVTWFFNHIDEGIILEDDCLPNESFFYFCSSLLEKYRLSPQVMMICGTSYQPKPLNNDTYYFSKYPHAWGWASWKRAWQNYAYALTGEDEATRSAVLSHTFSIKQEQRFWFGNLQMIINGLDAWDYQWMYWIWKNNGLVIVPWKNMIANIGFGPKATHTFDSNSWQSRMAQYNLSEMVHPLDIAGHAKADRYERYHILIQSPAKYCAAQVWRIIKYVLRHFKLYKDV